MSKAGQMARGGGGNPGARLAGIARSGGQSTPAAGDRASVARREAASDLGDTPAPLHVSDNDEIGEVSQSMPQNSIVSDPLKNDTRTGGSATASIKNRAGAGGRRDVLQPKPGNDSPRGEGDEVRIDGEKVMSFPQPKNNSTTGDGTSARISGERTMRGRQARRQGSERQQA